MLHRAILGSFERFIGILIEQYEAKSGEHTKPIKREQENNKHGSDIK